MSRKEVPRAGLVKAALAGKITNAEGARALRLSVRQFQRLRERVRTEGAPGLLHRSRGARRLAAAACKQVVRLMTTVYEGFNDVHLTEKLQEQHALPISRASVRRLRWRWTGPRPAGARHRSIGSGANGIRTRVLGRRSSELPPSSVLAARSSPALPTCERGLTGTFAAFLWRQTSRARPPSALT